MSSSTSCRPVCLLASVSKVYFSPVLARNIERIGTAVAAVPTAYTSVNWPMSLNGIYIESDGFERRRLVATTFSLHTFHLLLSAIVANESLVTLLIAFGESGT